MIYASTFDEATARSREVHVNGRDYLLREYVGAAPVRGTYVEGNEANDNAQPQGFLVDQPANAITKPHFHEHNQFQVFVEGGGAMGKQAAKPIGVHYAGAHTPYGPITAGDDGIRYFTLRQRWDPGAKYMPAMRDKLKRGRQRHGMAADLVQLTDAELSTLDSVQIDTVIAPESDAMQALIYRVPPGQSTLTLDPASAGGQYWLVLGGELEREGKHYDRLSIWFVTPDEPPMTISGGTNGVQLLLMQFPPVSE